MSSAASPLVLPELSRVEVARLNRLHRWRAPMRLPNNESFSLRLLEEDVPPPRDERLRLGFAVGEDRFEADLPRALMLDLMRSLDNNLSLDPLPPPDLAALLLEGALLPLVEAMDRGTARPVVLDALSEADGMADAGRRPVLLSGAGLHQLLAVGGAPAALDRLLDGWRGGRRPMGGLPLILRLSCGDTVLTPRLLRSLRVGDAVLLQRDHAAPASDGTASAAMLHVADSLGATVRRAGSGWRLDTALRPLDRTGQDVSENGSSAVDDPGRGAPDPRSSRDAELDALPVRLRFEAGQLELGLGALRELGAGSVLEFGGEPGRVAILCGGRRIGSGTLVSIEGRAGVRIDAFAEGLDAGAGA